jgi:hypothetical protein
LIRITKELLFGKAAIKQESAEYLKERRPLSERTVFKMEGTS